MKLKLLLPITFLSILTLACSKDEGENTTNPTLSFQLTDAPGDYEEVNVDVIGLRVHISGQNLDSTAIDSLDAGWIDLPINDSIYNLIHLRDSSVNLLSEFAVPEGKISQIRLLLGEDNSIKIEGDSIVYPLETPSAMQSGLKINLHADIEAGSSSDFTLDFDAEKSVIESGGQYKLKPVIKVDKTQ